MQAAKKAVESIKETAANVGASAKSGLEKTKATVQEKTERMTAHDPMQKEMATEKKEERINNAEMEKQEAREHNSEAKQSSTAGHMGHGHYTTTGDYSHPMEAHQGSAMPGHGLGHGLGLGLGQPTDNVSEGVVASNPVGTNTGMGRTTAHNTHGSGAGII